MTKDGPMNSLFNYHTISVSLDRKTKNCTVKVINDKSFCPLNFTKELENFFDWLTNKIEISSVLVEITHTRLNLWDNEPVKKLDKQAVLAYFKTIQRLSWSQLVLPQTIIWKFSEEVDFLALELASGADLRISSPSVTVKLNYAEHGLTPACGGCILLKNTTNQAKLKSYMLTGLPISATALVDLGLINIIEHGNETDQVIENIAKQSPIARMQLKRSLNNELIERIDDHMANELTFAAATISAGDWERKNKKLDFVNPRDLKRKLKNVPTVHEQKYTA